MSPPTAIDGKANAASSRQRDGQSSGVAHEARREPAMRVIIPPALHTYTDGRREVESNGATLAQVLVDLDRRYPGIRFRIIDEQDGIRQHIKIFINQTQTKAIETQLDPADKVLIICALSGG
jgi:molybdopterin converting factor small subunit